MKSKVQNKNRRPALTGAARSRALAWHVAKMTEIINSYAGTVFKAWQKLNDVTSEGENLKVHLAEFERIANEGRKCK